MPSVPPASAARSNLGDVVAQLPVGFAWIAAAPFGLDDGENLASRFVEAVVGDAVPRLGVVAVHGDLTTNLGLVVEAPVGLT